MRVRASSTPIAAIIASAVARPSTRVWVSRTSANSIASASVGNTRRRGCSPQNHSVKPSTTSARPNVPIVRTVGSRSASSGAISRP